MRSITPTGSWAWRISRGIDMDTCEPNCKELICPKCGARYSGDAREELIRQYFEMKKMEKKVEKPTYCKGCSFKCQASDCDCTCHDRMREAEQTKSERCECGHDKAWHNKEQGNICKAGRGEHFNAFSPQCLCKQFKPEKPIKAVQLGHCLKKWDTKKKAKR